MCKGDKFRCYAFSSTFVMYSFFCILFSLFLMFNARSSYAQWAASYVGAGGSSVEQTRDGGYIVGGGNGGDISVVRLDDNGAIQWQKKYWGNRAEYFGSLQQASDGGFVVTGNSGCIGLRTNPYVFGGPDFWVLKFDSSGNLLWQKTYGGISQDWANSIQQTSDDGYIVAGRALSFPLMVQEILPFGY